MAKTSAKATNLRAAASILQKDMKIDANQAATLVRRAKDGGCSAFDQRGCIDIAILKKWISANKESLSISAPVSLKDQKLNEEIRKLKIRNDRDERLVVLKSKVIESEDKFAAADDAILEQAFLKDLPSLIAGPGMEAQARIYGQRIWDRIRSERLKLSVLWSGL